MPTLADLTEPDCVVLMECTIPPDMTIAEWRRSRAAARVRSRRGPRLRLVREPRS
jgi:hypothetical protein